MFWTPLNPKVTPEHLGYIPSFLDEEDERPAREQLDANYRHGGGWRPQQGWQLKRTQGLVPITIRYPGGGEEPDTELKPLAFTTLHSREVIVMFPLGYVLIMQHNGQFEVARMD
jgi:hypothetical protein